MSDDILKKAISRRGQLAEEMKEIDSFIATYRRLQSDIPQNVTFATGTTLLTSAPNVSVKVRLGIEAATCNILREAGGTLTTKEILSRLIDHQFHVGGKDPINNLASVLSRSMEIENVRGKGWRLAERNDASPVSSGEASDSEGAA